jgi:hypothetical protein
MYIPANLVQIYIKVTCENSKTKNVRRQILL